MANYEYQTEAMDHTDFFDEFDMDQYLEKMSDTDLTALPKAASPVDQIPLEQAPEELPLPPYNIDDFAPPTNTFTPVSPPPANVIQDFQIPSRQNTGMKMLSSGFSPQQQLPMPIQQYGPSGGMNWAQLHRINYAPQNPLPYQQRQTTNMTYLNSILASFPNPSVPLRIIDRAFYPLPRYIHEVLERELGNQRYVPNSQSYNAYPSYPQAYRPEYSSRGMFQVPPIQLAAPNTYQSFAAPPMGPPPIPIKRQIAKPRASIARTASVVQAQSPVDAPRSPIATMPRSQSSDSRNTQRSNSILINGREPGNKRPINNLSFDPSDYYLPLSQTPETWGPNEQFTYTPYGELVPGKFSVADILHYISYNPHYLTLWIQNVPADAGLRYGNAQSDRCRFEHCPDPKHTIRKGDFRIAFDEHEHPHHASKKRRTTDPYHNAGYVHLYCMEKFLDFPSICQRLNIKPDTRKLLEGRNRMAINRDHTSMQDIALAFIQTSKPWAEFNESGTRPREYYSHTLCHALTMEHLSRQGRNFQRIREERGGNTIDIHRNNLDRYVMGRKQMVAERAAAAPPKLVVAKVAGSKPLGRPSKRKVVESDDEDDEDASWGPSSRKKQRRQ